MGNVVASSRTADMSRRRWPLVVGLAVLAVALVVLRWPRHADAPVPAEEAAAAPVPRSSTGSALTTSRGAPLPSAALTLATARPCVRGRVVHVVTGRGIADAQVTWATGKGVASARTDARGDFSLDVPEGAVSLAEVTAERFFPVRPSWGFSPLTFHVPAATCVSDVLLSLVPRIEYAGWVVGPDDEPIAGASITIATDDEPPGPALTSDADGRFTFTARDGAVLVARRDGFAPGSAVVDFRVGVSREVVLRLGVLGPDAGVAHATLSGVVVDERDAGLPGAQVKVLRRASAEGFERLEAVSESDADGHFSVEADGPAPWTVVAHVPGVVSASKVTHGEPVVLRVVAGASLAGRVTDTYGQPVTSFSVLASHEAGPLEVDREDARHFVDAEGRFEVNGLAPGPTRVVVAALGYAPSEAKRVTLVPGAPQTLDVTLCAGAKVTGQVVDRDTKAPLSGARVSLEGQGDATLSVSPSSRTGDDGRFELSGLPPGRRSLFFAASNHHARLVSVELRDGDTAGPLTVDLGAVPDGGTPQLELVGIGAVLKAQGDALVIQQVFEGGGAAEAGLVAGDGILSIDGEAAAKLGFVGGIEKIRGPEGTTVRLEVRRADGSMATVEAPRRRIAK